MIPETVITKIAEYSVSFAILLLTVYLLYIFLKHERNDRRDKDKQQNQVEKEFRDYLIKQGQEHHRIIERNSEAFERNTEINEKLIEILIHIMRQSNSGGKPY